jgi:integrase
MVGWTAGSLGRDVTGMAKQAKPLSARRVATERRPGMYADGGGLYLRVADAGSRGWIYRYQLAGKRREMGLGSAATFSLVEARDRARLARQQVADGLDPVDERRAKASAVAVERASAMTFRQCAEGYVRAHEAGWSAKHAAQFGGSLDAYAFPVFGDLPVQAVDVGLVMKVVEPVWTVKPETASRVRGRIEMILDLATARGYRQGDNPARWRGHLDKLLPDKLKVRAVKHFAALPYAEIGAFMVDLRQQEGVAARALEFAILTAARTGEVLGARWSEIDLEARHWTIPAERMKAGREHRVPLGGAAMAVIEQMTHLRQNDLVFPGARQNKPLSPVAFLRVIRDLGREGVTGHGFRSTFRDWAAELTSFPSEVAEMALGHQVSSAVEKAYRRGDMLEKRRHLAEAWSDQCAGEPPGNVVPLRVG